MPVDSFKLPSFAKINLMLRILGKRADNYHEICTIFQTVSLCDYLTFSDNSEITLTCEDKKILTDGSNLIIKAAKLLKEKLGIIKGAKIHLEKNIPAPGGLGGGSSNAAIALLGLLRLWKINVDFETLQEIGALLGADVPFFFHGGTALGRGRGTEITQIEDFEAQYLLIVTPNIAVSTKDAFARLNLPDLTNNSSKSILKICRDEANALDLQQSELENDFEKTIFGVEPETATVKEKLLEYGAKNALMSGSGASVFAIFETNNQRQKALKALQNEFDWRVFPAKTVSCSTYRKSLRLDEDFA